MAGLRVPLFWVSALISCLLLPDSALTGRSYLDRATSRQTLQNSAEDGTNRPKSNQPLAVDAAGNVIDAGKVIATPVPAEAPAATNHTLRRKLLATSWSDGKQISFFSGASGNFCSDDGSNGLNCTRVAAGPWETFTIKVVPGGQNYRFALRSGRTGKYCSDNPNGYACNRDNISSWETYTLYAIPGRPSNEFAFISNRTGLFCSDARPFTCNRKAVGPGESFTYDDTPFWPHWQPNAGGGATFSLPAGKAQKSVRGEIGFMSVNGCSGMNYAQYMDELNPACNAHDMCYTCAGSPGWHLDRATCDNLLYTNGNNVCEAVYGSCKWWLPFGKGCLCRKTVDIMKSTLDSIDFFKLRASNSDCSGRYPYSYATRPIRVGFSSDDCNGHPC